MTKGRDIERLLDAWLSEGPLQVTDRAFDDAVSRLRAERQRPAWRLRWRERTVSTPIRLVAAGIAAVAVLAVGLGALQLGGIDPGSSRSPTIGPTPSASPSPTATATPTLPPLSCVAGDCLGRLDPGTHTADAPLVPFSYTVPEGWQNPFNVLGGYMLERQGTSDGTAIFVWPDAVVADQTTCQKEPDPDFGRTAADIVGFVASHPGLAISESQPVTIGGLDGQWLDITKRPGQFDPCPSRVSLFVHSGSIEDGFWWDLPDDRRMHLYVLNAGDGHTVLINVESAMADQFEVFRSVATPIVESFDFTP